MTPWIWLAPLAAGWLVILLYTTRKRRDQDIDLGSVTLTDERRSMLYDAERRQRQK